MSTGGERVRAALRRAAEALGAPDVDFVLERPNDESHGDLATNLALLLARPLKQRPREIANEIVRQLDLPSDVVRRTEIAGPGFINFFLATTAVASVLETVLTAGATYGRSDVGEGRCVNVEFVSANPTGPLHVGHGRQAVLGDAIAALLDATGWAVTREYYYNDAGAQIAKLVASVQARAAEAAGRAADIPEGGYHGDYIKEIAERYAAEYPEDREAHDAEAVRRFAVRMLREEQDRDLKAIGVTFDVYYLESSLHDEGRVDATVRRLIERGYTYEQDGALWLRTTAFGDDKDRVLRRSAAKGGEYTYFVPDVAYHVTKWERGFQRAIDVQGADHHSTTTRVRVGLQALGRDIPEGYPEYVLHQMVRVMRGGEELKISKRAGSYLTLRDLVDEVGRDAVRYFFLMRKSDSQFVFDVDLAKRHTDENPVYYVQYAHTRLAGIFRTADVAPDAVGTDFGDPNVLTDSSEQELLKRLADFPGTVAAAAGALEPHRLVAYLEDVARLVNGWYHRCRVVGESEPVQNARLQLARAAQIVLAGGLALIGVSAPERM